MREFLSRTTGQRTTGTRGVLRGPRGPKKQVLHKDLENNIAYLILSCAELLLISAQLIFVLFISAQLIVVFFTSAPPIFVLFMSAQPIFVLF